MMKTALFALSLTIATAAPALAAPDGTLSASPAVVMLRGVAGQSTTQTLTILNNTSRTMQFAMEANDVAVRHGERVLVAAGQMAGSIAATAVFSSREVSVAPGQKASVDVTVTLPAKPTVRAIVALFHGVTKVKQGKVDVTASLGTLLTFAVSDRVTAEASPLAVKAQTVSSNLSVEQRLLNTGSEPVLAKGMLAIVSAAGALVARETLPPRRLLPGETTNVRAEYGGELPAGHYRALVTYDLQNNQTLTSSADFDVK